MFYLWYVFFFFNLEVLFTSEQLMRQIACQEFYVRPFFALLREINFFLVSVWYILKTIIHLHFGE